MTNIGLSFESTIDLNGTSGVGRSPHRAMAASLLLCRHRPARQQFSNSEVCYLRSSQSATEGGERGVTAPFGLAQHRKCDARMPV